MPGQRKPKGRQGFHTYRPLNLPIFSLHLFPIHLNRSPVHFHIINIKRVQDDIEYRPDAHHYRDADDAPNHMASAGGFLFVAGLIQQKFQHPVKEKHYRQGEQKEDQRIDNLTRDFSYKGIHAFLVRYSRESNFSRVLNPESVGQNANQPPETDNHRQADNAPDNSVPAG